MDKDHKKFMANWINLLHGSVNAASHSPQHICIVTDMSNPSLPLQSAMAFRLWHEGDLYNNWSAAGLATSDNAGLQAIMDGIRQAYNVGLEDIHQVHVFSNSTNVSHHLGQYLSLSICKVLVPWLRHHPNNSVHFHHITVGVELEDHQWRWAI
jgi:ribonuclease HI